MQANPNRRGTLLILAGAVAALSCQAQTGKSATKIHQEVDFPATPSIIYKALLDSKQFGAITGLPAEIQPQPGGSLKMFGDLVEGRNIELVPDQRVVQAWREASWPTGQYSLVRFELIARGPGTHLVFDQTGIAEEDFGHLNEGWPIRYWEPLRKYLTTGSPQPKY
jgi:activator of HSP90 ATPase